MPPRYLRKASLTRLKHCQERTFEACETAPTDQCCGVIPCKLCLEFETYEDGILVNGWAVTNSRGAPRPPSSHGVPPALPEDCFALAQRSKKPPRRVFCVDEKVQKQFVGKFGFSCQTITVSYAENSNQS